MHIEIVCNHAFERNIDQPFLCNKSPMTFILSQILELEVEGTRSVTEPTTLVVSKRKSLCCAFTEAN